jgi:hypothetical protein
MLPYQRTISNKISRLLAKHNIKTVHIPAKKISIYLRLVRDKLGLKVSGIYHIPCECSKVYVGQTGRTIEARCKEHMRHVCLEQPERSTVAEQWIDTGHHINFNGTSILGMATRYMDRLVREAIEIWLHPNNFNRDKGFSQSRTWHPLISVLKRSRDTPMGKQRQAELGM